MSSFPRSPRFRKGAIVTLETVTMIPRVIMFQFNPDTLSRTLTPKTSRTQTEPLRIEGPPDEEIELEIELDATDQLEFPDQNLGAVAAGIGPQLAALEIILYPKTADIVTNSALASTGAVEIVPSLSPLTLFVWGPSKVLPVKLTRFRITEEAHDTELNPIRAKVSISMKVLTYTDLQQSKTGYALYMSNHLEKEIMALLGYASNIGSIGAAF